MQYDFTLTANGGQDISALGKGDAAVTDEVVAGVEFAFGYDCDVMTIYTRRGGLVRKLEAAGYREAAKIMRKKIEK